MVGPVLVPALVSLRSEFNALAPNRDKGAEGWIGDAAHQGTPSGHNPDESGVPENYDSDNIDEVRAIDIDKDLRLSDMDMQDCVDIIVGNHRAGRDNRLDYVIYNYYIYERQNGWRKRSFPDSPHTDHAHFSSLPGSGSGTQNPENRTQPWGLLAAQKAKEDDYVSATNDQIQLTDQYKKIVDGNSETDSLATIVMTIAIWSVRAASAAADARDNSKAVLAELRTLNSKFDTLNANLAALVGKLPPQPPANQREESLFDANQTKRPN